MNLFLSEGTSVQVMEKIISADVAWHYDPEKHKVDIHLPQTSLSPEGHVYFRLPISIPFPPIAPDPLLKPFKYVIILIQSGQCALGNFEGPINLDHKVFRSYMVRKKQGKSQIKYLKTKGKSRAGSRVRLGETVEFFENINERLQQYFKNDEIDKIALCCSKTLIPYFYNAKVTTPFNKKDERIFKIPMHVHTPTYDILLDVQKFLLKGEVIYEEAHKSFVDSILG